MGETDTQCSRNKQNRFSKISNFPCTVYVGLYETVYVRRYSSHACPQVVSELGHPDSAGSESELGLSPGGRVKLIKSSVIKLQNPLRYVHYVFGKIRLIVVKRNMRRCMIA